MSITTRCGNCRALLSVADTLSGKKARCPKCGQGFAVLPIADNAPSPVRPATPKRTAPMRTAPKRTAQAKTAAGGVRSEGRVRAETDPDDEPPRARRKRRRTNESSNHGLKLGLSIGGGGLALVVALIVIVAIPRTRTQPDPVPMARPAAEATVNAQNGSGTKITVRVEINGSPPKFQGDFDKHVTEKLEIALRNLGYVPVQDGGMILRVKAQIGPNGKRISVKDLGDIGPGKQPSWNGSARRWC